MNLSIVKGIMMFQDDDNSPMFSVSSGNVIQDQTTQVPFLLTLLSLKKPSDENIQEFISLGHQLITDCGSIDSPEFRETVFFLTNFYNDQSEPVWQMLAANVIYNMYTSSIPRSGLPLSNPHIKKCLQWGEAVINTPITNNRYEIQIKGIAYKWLAGLYKRRGAAEIDSPSGQALIQTSVNYYEKMFDLTNAHPGSKYPDISFILLKIEETQALLQPKNTTLKDEGTQNRIRALERVIAFHSNVPDDKKSKTTFAGLKQAKLEIENVAGIKTNEEAAVEIEQLNSAQPPREMWDHQEKMDAYSVSIDAMSKLAKLYASVPKSPGSEPDYQRAVIWLDKVVESGIRDERIDELLENSEIKQARAEVNSQLAQTIETTFIGLLDLTDTYLAKNDIDASKSDIFAHLRSILGNPSETKSKHERIILFKNTLSNLDKNMLCAHRTAAWQRYVYNAFSFCTIIPAIVRAIDSYVKYGTASFWKSDSQKAVEMAEENCSQIDLGTFTK